MKTAPVCFGSKAGTTPSPGSAPGKVSSIFQNGESPLDSIAFSIFPIICVKLIYIKVRPRKGIPNVALRKHFTTHILNVVIFQQGPLHQVDSRHHGPLHRHPVELLLPLLLLGGLLAATLTALLLFFVRICDILLLLLHKPPECLEGGALVVAEVEVLMLVWIQDLLGGGQHHHLLKVLSDIVGKSVKDVGIIQAQGDPVGGRKVMAAEH